MLSRSALGTGLRKAGGEYDQRLYALLRTLTRRTDDSGRRYCHDRQLDVTCHVQHRLEGAHRLHDVGMWVHRMHRAVETGGEQIVEDLRSDGAALSRGTDHSHGRRLEEPAHGGDRGGALPVFEALSRSRGDRCRHLHRDQIRLGSHPHGESALAKDPCHPEVLGKHTGFEDGHPLLFSGLGEVHEQNAAQAAALKVVRHCEGDLGTVAVRQLVAGVPDDAVRWRRWSRSGRSGARNRRRLPTSRPPPDLLRARRTGRRESPATAHGGRRGATHGPMGVPAARARRSRRAVRRRPRDARDRPSAFAVSLTME